VPNDQDPKASSSHRSAKPSEQEGLGLLRRLEREPATWEPPSKSTAQPRELLYRLLKARQCVRHAGQMLLAQLGGRKATLDHRHQRLSVARLEDELDLEFDDRSARPTLGRVDDEVTGPVDHPEDVVVAAELLLAVVNAEFDTGFPPTAHQYEVALVGA
jgi:hypothetical protein